MARLFMKMKYYLLGLTVLLLVTSFQNCQQVKFSALDSGESLLPSTSSIPLLPLSGTIKGLVGSNTPLPQLKMFFIVDNSATMDAENANVSGAVSTMFNSRSADDLAAFDTEAFVASTAQTNDCRKFPSLVYNGSTILNQTKGGCVGPNWVPDQSYSGLFSDHFYTNPPANLNFSDLWAVTNGYNPATSSFNESIISSVRSAKYGLSYDVPGDMIGFRQSNSTDAKGNGVESFVLAPVVNVQNGLVKESVHSSDYNNHDDFISSLQSQISLLTPSVWRSKYPWNTAPYSSVVSSGGPLPLYMVPFNNQLDGIISRESGLCAVARVLKEMKATQTNGKKANRFMASTNQQPIFILMSDENDWFADGSSCVDSVTYAPTASSYTCMQHYNSATLAWAQSHTTTPTVTPSTCYLTSFINDIDFSLNFNHTTTLFKWYYISGTKTGPDGGLITVYAQNSSVLEGDLSASCNLAYIQKNIASNIYTDTSGNYPFTCVSSTTNSTVGSYGVGNWPAMQKAPYSATLAADLQPFLSNHANNKCSDAILNYAIDSTAIKQKTSNISNITCTIQNVRSSFPSPVIATAASGAPDYTPATCQVLGDNYCRQNSFDQCTVGVTASRSSPGVLVSQGMSGTVSTNTNYILKLSDSCQTVLANIVNVPNNYSAFDVCKGGTTTGSLQDWFNSLSAFYNDGTLYSNLTIRSSLSNLSYDLSNGWFGPVLAPLALTPPTSCPAGSVVEKTRTETYSFGSSTNYSNLRTGVQFISGTTTSSPSVTSEFYTATQPATDLKTYIINTSKELFTSQNMPIFKLFIKAKASDINPSMGNVGAQSVGTDYIDFVNKYNQAFMDPAQYTATADCSGLNPSSPASCASLLEVTSTNTPDIVAANYSSTFQHLNSYVRSKVVRIFKVADPVTGQFLPVKSAQEISNVCIKSRIDIANAKGDSSSVACTEVPASNWKLEFLPDTSGKSQPNIAITDAVDILQGDEIDISYAYQQ